MAEGSRSKKPPPSGRDARLKAALKANMAKRKAQARARADASDDTAEQKDDKGQADG